MPFSCGNPGQVAHSVRTVVGQSVGQTVTFKCKPGFRMSGSSKRKCLQVGRWSNSLPTCKRKFLLQLCFCQMHNNHNNNKNNNNNNNNNNNGLYLHSYLDYLFL